MPPRCLDHSEEPEAEFAMDWYMARLDTDTHTHTSRDTRRFHRGVRSQQEDEQRQGIGHTARGLERTFTTRENYPHGPSQQGDA